MFPQQKEVLKCKCPQQSVPVCAPGLGTEPIRPVGPAVCL